MLVPQIGPEGRRKASRRFRVGMTVRVSGVAEVRVWETRERSAVVRIEAGALLLVNEYVEIDGIKYVEVSGWRGLEGCRMLLASLKCIGEPFEWRPKKGFNGIEVACVYPWAK